MTSTYRAINPAKWLDGGLFVREVELEHPFVTVRAQVTRDGWSRVVQFVTSWRVLESVSGLTTAKLAKELLFLDNEDCRKHLVEGLWTAYGLLTLDRLRANGA